MKSAIKTAVAELLPVLAARPLDSEFPSGDRAIDADGEELLSMTGYVCQQIETSFASCSFVVCSFKFLFLILGSDIGGGASLASKLRSLSSDCFVQLLSAIFMIVQVSRT